MASSSSTITGRASTAKKPAPKKKRLVNHKGGAPIGNKFWLMRSSHGRKPAFTSPEQLQSACHEYFAWCDKHPFTGAIPRPMTMDGLLVFLDIAKSTWKDYAQQQGFSETIVRVEHIIRDQKFAGAAVGHFNANLISRDLGLSDRTEVSGPGGSPLMKSGPSKRELAKALAIILAKGLKPDAG